MIPKIKGHSRLPVCTMPNRKNILKFLQFRQVPQTIAAIRFGLDTTHGCVWSPSQVEKVLCSLERDGLVYCLDGEWGV